MVYYCFHGFGSPIYCNHKKASLVTAKYEYIFIIWHSECNCLNYRWKCCCFNFQRWFKTKKKEEVLPNAPFRMSKEEMRCVDKRALTVCVPQGYGRKPSAGFLPVTWLHVTGYYGLLSGMLPSCPLLVTAALNNALTNWIVICKRFCHVERYIPFVFSLNLTGKTIMLYLQIVPKVNCILTKNSIIEKIRKYTHCFCGLHLTILR